MSGKKKGGGGGGHGGAWVITFADLVSLLMAFFVMIVSFSNQDEAKLHDAAGSMKEAFGVQPVQRPAGIIERQGLPLRKYARSVGADGQQDGVDFSSTRKDQKALQGPEANTHDTEMADVEKPGQFTSAAASLRQALADMPDFTELSKQIRIEETKEGVDIQLVDQDQRAMFGRGSSLPSSSLQRVLQNIAPVLNEMSMRVRVMGHTSSQETTRSLDATAWKLSMDRAYETAEVLKLYGLRPEQIESISGKADTDPLFQDDPSLAANRRVEMVLLHEAPPYPQNITP